jgi:hypothetical protein
VRRNLADHIVALSAAVDTIKDATGSDVLVTYWALARDSGR